MRTLRVRAAWNAASSHRNATRFVRSKTKFLIEFYYEWKG